MRDELVRQALQLSKFNAEFVRQIFKSGGYIEATKAGQNKNEARKNIEIYTQEAKLHGKKHKLLGIIEGINNPDAWDDDLLRYSDAKASTSPSGKNAVQNSIRDASSRSSEEAPIAEVVIRLLNIPIS